LVLFQSGKRKVAVIRREQNRQLNGCASQQTPDSSQDLGVKKSNLSASRSVTRSSAKSTPQMITSATDDKVCFVGKNAVLDHTSEFILAELSFFVEFLSTQPK